MRNTIKTLALLKVTLIQHPNINDYLDIFIPFLIALIEKNNITNLRDVEEICSLFSQEYGLIIPHHPMISIITRLYSAGYCSQITLDKITPNWTKINTEEFTRLSNLQEEKFQELIDKYILFAKEKHEIILTIDQASSHFVLLLEDHDIDIVFANENRVSVLPPIDKSKIGINLAYDFIRHVYANDVSNFDLVSDIAFGHIIASSLLFPQSEESPKPYQKNNYYLDIGILFGLYGINGEYEKTVYEDFLRLLKSSNGLLYVFEHTRDEFVKIVEACKAWIDNPTYDAYKANRTLVCFKSWGFHEIDIDIFISRIPRILALYGIEVVGIPDPNKENDFQIDNIDLQDQIIQIYKKNNPNFNEDDKEDTIYLDVKSASSIFKQRKGFQPRNISESKYIFITRNSSLAYACKLFEKNIQKCDRFYIPTTVTDIFVGTMLWLNSPMRSNLQNLSKKKLIANSYAALQPSKKLKKQFLKEVDNAERDELFTQDELVILRTSKVAEGLLQEKTLGDSSKVNPRTPIEIMEEIRSIEKAAARVEIDNIKKEHEEIEKENARQIDQKDSIISSQNNEIKQNEEMIRSTLTTIYSKAKKKARNRSLLVLIFFSVLSILLYVFQSEIINLIKVKFLLLLAQILSGSLAFLDILNLTGVKKISDKVFTTILQKDLKSYNLTIEDLSNYLGHTENK